MMISNLNQLKKALQPGAKFTFTWHGFRPETVGQVRVVNLRNTVSIYSAIDGQPDHPISRANYGKGYFMEFGKATNWTFSDGLATYSRTRRPGGAPEPLFTLRVLEA